MIRDEYKLRAIHKKLKLPLTITFYYDTNEQYMKDIRDAIAASPEFAETELIRSETVEKVI